MRAGDVYRDRDGAIISIVEPDAEMSGWWNVLVDGIAAVIGPSVPTLRGYEPLPGTNAVAAASKEP